MKTSEPQPASSELISTRQPSLRPWLWLLAIALLLGGGVAAWRMLRPSSAETAQQPPQSIPVKLQLVESSRIQDSAEFVGTLQAEEGADLRPETEGRVTRIYVAEGARVARGNAILQISPDRSRAELSASLANINAARAARNSAQSELRAREAERISAVADVELQNSEFERTRVLVAEGVQARQQLDQAVRNRNAAIAALNSAIEQVGAARANVDEANAALAQAQAEADAVREDLEQTLVTAPIAGVVGDIPIKLGDYVSLGDTLTTITQNQTLELELSIPLEQRDALQIGLPVQIVRLQGDSSASSSPANQAAGASAVDRPTATGRISFISPQANANSQSVLVKASFANPDGLLQDEQRVDAKVIWRERPGILVPVNAISRLGGETFVYVAETQPNPEQGGQTIARQKRVQLGSIQGNSYQVLEGLEAGEQIVVSGLLNLSDGVPIMPESQNPAGQAPQPAE